MESERLRDERTAIPPTLEADEMMWAAGAYIFWPVLWLPFLLSQKKIVPFVRFHTFQGLIFGGVASFFFLVLSLIIFVLFRTSGTQSMALGIVFVGLFGLWLAVLFALFLMFLYYAYRAGQGDVYRITIIGGLAESWALSSQESVDEEI